MLPSRTSRRVSLIGIVVLSVLTPAVWSQIVLRRQLAAALRDALFRDQAPAVVALVERGADVNTRDLNGQTALHWAVRRGRRSFVRELLDRGAHLNVRGPDHSVPRLCSFEREQQRTPLMIAARRGDLAMVQL